MKKYIVTGKNFLDQPVSEVVYANTPGEAVKASIKVAHGARALSPATAADRSKK